MKHGLSTVILLLTALAAAAQIAERPLPQATAGLLELDRVAPGPAWRAFGSLTGWRIADWDRVHSYPHRAFGPGLELPGGPILGAADLDQRLRAFLDSHPGLFSGAGNDGAEAISLQHAERHGKYWYAAYHQTWRGRRVEQSELTFRVSPGGRLLLAGSDLHPRIEALEPRLNASEAAERAGSLSTGLALKSVLVERDWVLIPLLGERGFRYRSAWPCRVVLADPEHVYRVFIDGETGEAIWTWNEVRHVTLSGQLLGLVEEEQPSDPDLPHPMPHLQLTVNGQSFTTDATGHFTVEATGAAPWLIGGECYGLFANVNRQDGPDASFILQMNTANQDLTVTLDQAEVVELDAYHHTTRAHDFITDMDPSFTWLNEPLTVRVNINETCNAYWDGNSINFFREGGGCPNTGRVAGVVYHEYGHGINDRQYRQAGEQWGMSNGAMHEGLADVTSIYMQDEHFVSPGWFIRELDNNNRYPENIQGEVHYDGLIIGGAMFDLRQSLGLDLVRPMHHFARWGTPDDPDLGRACFEYYLELLLLDDDDEDLSNLTPHFQQIDTAFNDHGVGSVLTWMGTEFALEQPPFLNEPLQPLPLRARLSAPAFVSPEAVRVHYWSATQPEQILDLVLGEDGAWTGELPGQPWNTVLMYYAEVLNDADVEILSPPGAPEQVFRTRFVWNAGISEGFEEAPAAVPLNDVWQWGTPQDGPGGAYEGERCWGTNLGGNYPDMSVARVVTDPQVIRDDDQVIVSFHHWMAVEEGWDGVNVELSISGGAWQLITPLSGYDFTTPDNNALPYVQALTGNTDGWEILTFDVTDQTSPGDEIQLRLNLLTDTAVTDAGWYVDLLEYLGVQSPPVIGHRPLGDSEDADQLSFLVEATLETPALPERFDLVWRVDGGDTQILPMLSAGESYSASIPGPFWEQTIEYRLEVEGEGGFTGFLPEDPASWLSFHVGVDQEAPQVAFRHAPGDAVGWSALWPVQVEASDNLETPLQAVWLEWRTNGGPWLPMADLVEGDNQGWSTLVDFQPGAELGTLEVRAGARDASTQHWTSMTEAVSITMGIGQLVDTFENPLLPGWQIEGVFVAQANRVHGGALALGTGDDGFYEPLASGRAMLTQGFDLRQVTDPALVLWECWFLENGDDEAWIEISGDGGEGWDLLAMRTGGRAWAETRLSLAPWAGSADVRVRFGFQADGDSDGLHIGYFVDDLRVVNQSGLVVEEASPILSSFILGQPWPNPFNPICRVDLVSVDSRPLRLAVFNLLGQEVAVLHDGPLSAGDHAFTLDGRSLASGMYLVAARQAGRQEVRRVLLVR